MNNTSKRVPKGALKFSVSLTDEQKLAKAEIINNPFTFIMGPAGTGKSMLACQTGLSMLMKREVNQIIITRPAVSSEDIGFLPGSLKEKLDPWMEPIRSNMRKIYNKPDKLTKYEEEGQIEVVSIAHFRGRTFDNCFCIVDEFQNLTKQQLQMCIGRLGVNSKMVFCGDKYQIDLRFSDNSGIHLVDAICKSDYASEVILTENHRHPAIQDILNRLTAKY